MSLWQMMMSSGYTLIGDIFKTVEKIYVIL